MKRLYKTSLWIFGILLVVSCSANQVSKTDDPVIKRWTEVKDGKTIKYMTINGVMVHERDPQKQPPPEKIAPGRSSCGDQVGTAPSDAVVLFDGTAETMEKEWANPKWRFVNGVMESVKKAGYNTTRRKFGSCQLHIEWATPAVVKGKDQGRGNSGVFLMDYEIQILDSFEHVYPDGEGGTVLHTYPDGQAGALYGRKKPDVNASLPSGEWQTYDIIFHRPLFDEQGNVVRKATFTVLHNGVLIHDHVLLSGGTGWEGPHSISPYKKHDDAMPIRLQDHGNPVRFRNIWVRRLED